MKNLLFTQNAPSSKENRRHSSVLVPYSLYHCRIPDFYPSVPMHWHEEFELDYIADGEGQIHLEREVIPVQQGDLVIIPPNTLHAAFCPTGKKLNYKAFVFHHGILGTGSRDRSCASCIYPVVNGSLLLRRHIPDLPGSWPELYKCMDEILSSAERNLPLEDLLLKSSLLRLFYLIEKEPSMFLQEDSPGHGGDIIKPALSYMEEHFREPVSIEALAQCCNISPSYFMSCFKKTAGRGAIEHLTQLRIMNICEELLLTSNPISEIAYHNGFENLSNFNRQFQKYIGVSPRCYRETKSKGSPLTEGSPVSHESP